LRAEFHWLQTRSRALPVDEDPHRWHHLIRQMRFPISVLYWSNA